MRSTPLGMAKIMLRNWFWALVRITFFGVSTAFTVTDMFSSVAENSALTMVSNFLAKVLKAVAFLAGTAKTAMASRGMALRKLPPQTLATHAPYSLTALVRKRTAILLALARPRLMSMPEWPPCRPVTVNWKPFMSAGVGMVVYLRSKLASIPPAQPTYISPSVSESRLMRILPFTKPFFNPKAPVMPVSSSMVTRISSGPCFTPGVVTHANAAHTPTPLSAPRVVLLARTQPLSMMGSMGFFRKSNFGSSACGTMSVWPCRITGVHFSMPLVAGTVNSRLPVLSCSTFTLWSFAHCFIHLMAASSCLEGCGQSQRFAKFSHKSWGYSFNKSLFIFLLGLKVCNVRKSYKI